MFIHVIISDWGIQCWRRSIWLADNSLSSETDNYDNTEALPSTVWDNSGVQQQIQVGSDLGSEFIITTVEKNQIVTHVIFTNLFVWKKSFGEHSWDKSVKFARWIWQIRCFSRKCGGWDLAPLQCSFLSQYLSVTADDFHWLLDQENNIQQNKLYTDP